MFYLSRYIGAEIIAITLSVDIACYKEFRKLFSYSRVVNSLQSRIRQLIENILFLSLRRW